MFRYREDRLPVFLISALFFADVVAYFSLNNVYAILVWMLLGIFPKACICAWNHHHQHVHTFRSVVLNRILEIIYAFHTGITTNAWVLHHNLGHHVNYLDQSKDESGWKDSRGETMSAFRYTLTIAITGYVRAYRVGRSFPKYQSAFIRVGTLVAALLALAIWYRPVQACLLFLLPMLCGYIITCWHTYYHHAGLETENPYDASHNIMHSWYNLCTGNLGYHTAHHVKPGLHWSRLPDFHASISHKIPAHLFRRPCIPFRWFPDRSKGKDIERVAA